ncbi:hypothetical protein NUU61_007631 [Penicillium alfredii]|uniref:Uncharacterized protein n=1 Tax=Penicillium alfredii TaxID=1506179 RepID=A0A9W9JY77_9EURO|nr:uncharacterized protein NUU61_007631 [Penicillium alfredii]KAJ5086324.1 hypothetical protein NUU61_007631 [Penicillium alfredii]
MNRYRNAPGLRGPSKATASTLCQKCLKRDKCLACFWSSADFKPRHYSYECKATAQERPYQSRPSRTQQLQNPKLMPKLSTEVPNELLRSKGVADEILAKRDEERGRKRDLDGEDTTGRNGQSPKPARSMSSDSMNSVSTISTSRSYSASPARHDRGNSHGDGHRDSVSPPAKSRKRRYSDYSEGYSASSYSGARQRSGSREWAEDRNTRRRRRETSPEERGRHRGSERHGSQQDRHSHSVDQSRVAKGRHSLTPNAAHDRSERRSYRDRASPPAQPQRSRQGPRTWPEPPRERSLSPFSKRLALTQAMNLR